MLETFEGLIGTLKLPLEELDSHAPKEAARFMATLSIALESLRNEEQRQAFLEFQESPADPYGNPMLLSTMYSTVFFVLRNTYRGITAIETGEEYKQTKYYSLTMAADEAFGKGTIRTPTNLKNVLPLLDEIERELEKFPSSETHL